MLACGASAPSAAAQSGGTPVPGPGDPCPAVYPGDDARQAAIARWMARGAALRDLPQELPVMAGLAESGLRNLRTPGGSFFGFFGMHRSLNSGDYRGFPRNPELQLRWFTDTAILVRQRAIAAGAEDFGRADGLRALDRRRGASGPAEPRRLPAPPRRRGRDRDRLLPARRHVERQHAAGAARTAARRQRDAITLRVRCPRRVLHGRRAGRAAPPGAPRTGRSSSTAKPVTLTDGCPHAARRAP